MSGNPRLAVIGGGLAGLTAAVRAAERGAVVTVLEAGTEVRYASNSRYAGGLFHVALRDITSPPAVLYEAVRAVAKGYGKDSLAQALASDAGHMIEWLAGHGAVFEPPGDAEYMSRRLAPFVLQSGSYAQHWPDRGADRLMQKLEEHLTLAGGQILRGMRAQDLIQRGEQVCGIVARAASGGIQSFEVDAVLIADGGFSANIDMLREQVGPQPEKLCQRGAGTSRGDGLRMAAAVGAVITQGDGFYGHLQCQEALTDDSFWPYPVLDLLAATGLIVDSNGRRITNEGLGGIAITNALAAMEDPLSCSVVIDDAIWNGPVTSFLAPPNPMLVERGAKIYQAGTIEELAAQLDTNPSAMRQTVDGHNKAVDTGKWDIVVPPRSVSKTAFAAQPMRIEKPPFMAIRICPGITYTLGGILTDDHGRVMATKGGSIAGLYAAGSATGGLEGGPHTAYAGGLAKAGVFGLRAADAMIADHAGTAAKHIVPET